MDKEQNHSSLRRKVTREAAVLLYTLQEKEFRQAKEKAAEILGVRVLPTNLEIAEELDLIADEHEGEERHMRLIRMRREALETMEALKEFYPKLIGSVWRGTANKNSDIDITVFSQDEDSVIEVIRKRNLKVLSIDSAPLTKGKSGESLHVFIGLPSGDKVEVTVKSLESMDEEEQCEIYGDLKKGLNIEQLRKVLEEDPLKRFIPKKRINSV